MLTGSRAADARGAGRQFLLSGVAGLLLAGLFWMHGLITSSPAPGSMAPGSMTAVSMAAGSVDAAAGMGTGVGTAEMARGEPAVSAAAGLLAPSDRQRPGQVPGHGGHALGHLCVAVLAAGIAVLAGAMLARSTLRATPVTVAAGAGVMGGPGRRDGPDRRGERVRLMLSVWRI